MSRPGTIEASLSSIDSYRDPWLKRIGTASSRGGTAHSDRRKSASAGSALATSKSTPLLKASQAAPAELASGEPEFADEKPLLKELRAIFDWMAQEAGATRIPSRLVKQRLPMIHRRMPFMASSFRRMDANGDCWLEWDEFVNFCLSDVRLIQQMRRSSTISVYGRQRNGSATYKEQLNPQLMCEMGTPPPLLSWEVGHVVEWRVEGLVIGPRKGSPVTYGTQIVRPGTSIASPPFRGAGTCGYLRLFPSGYWTEAQRRSKVAVPHASADVLVLGPYPMPPSDAWCCLGACMPAGTHLVLRFFVGDMKSEKRECYWHSGTHPGTLWSPPQQEPPILGEGDSITVGIEIFGNIGGNVEKKPALQKEKGKWRCEDGTTGTKALASVAISGIWHVELQSGDDSMEHAWNCWFASSPDSSSGSIRVTGAALAGPMLEGSGSVALAGEMVGKGAIKFTFDKCASKWAGSIWECELGSDRWLRGSWKLPGGATEKSSGRWRARQIGKKGVKNMTPGIKEPFESWRGPGMDRSTSLPALPSGSSWRKLDTLLQAHRWDEKIRSRSEAKFAQTC